LWKIEKLLHVFSSSEMSESKGPIVYTDGSCDPNPGAGGWGFISLDPAGDWHVNGGEAKSTNNRMELMAIIEALRFHANETVITIRTDSQLCMNCAKGLWKRKKNKDLWAIYDTVSKNIEIVWEKVKAHSGDKYNDLVDELAKSAMRQNKKK
jgi:ribonuclease HI